MITDVSVIISYLDNGDTKQAYSLMGMMGLSISLQLVLAYVQNRKKSKWALIRELLIVLSGLKPAVDAYRVATGYESEFSTLDPLMDMSAGKGIELACESIPGESSEKMKIENDKNSRTNRYPGSLLQVYVYITSPKKATFNLVSILISTMTTAFSSAMVSYDQDVSVKNRKKNPEFYGYVKDTSLERTSTFLVMMLLAACHNLSRTIGTALLLAVSGSTTFVIMGAEMAVYIGFKVLRNDLVLWVPGLEGALKYIVAMILHTVVKVLVDFTGESTLCLFLQLFR